ncbi:MAG: hypothetical protein ACXVRS_03415 [Gaiellaceae bacterium]
MARLLELIAIDVVVGLSSIFGVMYLVAGWRWGDLRDVLLHDAYRSFTFEGDRIPGLAPGLAARLVIRWLSDAEDGRLVLVPELRPQVRGFGAPVFDRLLVAECEIESAAVFRA